MPHKTPFSTPHTTGDQADRRARALTGALAIAALVAALVALWQTQSTPLGGRSYCWGAWPEDEAPFHRGDHDRTADESAPAPGRPTGHCSLRWRGGRGLGAYEQQVDLRLGTGPRQEGERRSWLGELFGDGDTPLPDGLPGFTAASGAGALVLPESCDVDGRPSVVTLKSITALSPATMGELLVRAANKATKATSCTTLPPIRLHRDPSAPTPSDAGRDRCGIPGLVPSPVPATGSPAPAASRKTSPAPAAGPTGPTPGSSASSDFHSCAIAGAQGWAARFLSTGRPRLVALFDGLTGDRPPAPGWRAHGSIDAAGALVRADCGGRPTVFTMRSGPGRTRTGLDDPREAFPRYVDAVAAQMGCAPLRAG
ncbi:hypothetical protein [Streptomyces telluris]|uniref:Uncharacterized protein n=1 Tax=Streptomyces telluris TaxID=2720021 RepID=A0A9X2LI51_9ACTN|nr:hypothetical protein [Streptomyces telluris]MCQ8770315.1 hypothetical protein [Streptomyces telluris]NJP77921.1 hypothetical protein [Streptomyces telluris]